MAAFITNFQSPVEMEDLKDRLCHGRISNIDMILEYERFFPLKWTVDKNAKIGDTVVFMCAKSSIAHIRHLCTLIRNEKEEDTELGKFAFEQREKYKQYAGKIIAVGEIAEKPFQTFDSGWKAPYWRSPWYAEISNVKRLNIPVSIDQFRDFILISRTGAITRLTEEQWRKLKELIEITNE